MEPQNASLNFNTIRGRHRAVRGECVAWCNRGDTDDRMSGRLSSSPRATWRRPSSRKVWCCAPEGESSLLRQSRHGASRDECSDAPWRSTVMVTEKDHQRHRTERGRVSLAAIAICSGKYRGRVKKMKGVWCGSQTPRPVGRKCQCAVSRLATRSSIQRCTSSDTHATRQAPSHTRWGNWPAA